jgi:hypothetical protein
MSSVDHVDSRSRDPWGDRLVPFWIQKTHENTERERECMYPVDFHLNLSADDQSPARLCKASSKHLQIILRDHRRVTIGDHLPGLKLSEMGCNGCAIIGVYCFILFSTCNQQNSTMEII